MTDKHQNEGSAQEGPDQGKISIQGSADDSISILVLGDRNTINQGPSCYTINVFGSFDANQFTARPSQQTSQQEDSVRYVYQHWHRRQLPASGYRECSCNQSQDISRSAVGLHDEKYHIDKPVLVSVDAASAYYYVLESVDHRDKNT